MQARYVILRVLLEGGGGLVSVDKIQVGRGLYGWQDILVKLDRSLIETRGKNVIRDFLTKLQVRSFIETTTVFSLGMGLHCIIL